MDISDFDRFALSGRSKLIAVYAYYTQERDTMTQSESAAFLTQAAVDMGMIQSRSPILGETLSSWSNGQRNTKIPLWAVTTAALLLFQKYHWFPEGELQRCAFASIVFRHFGCLEAALQYVAKNGRCQRDELSPYLDLAKRSRDSYLAKR